MTRYGLDKKGFILTKVGMNKIKPEFKKILEEINFELINQLKDKIHSLYLYGSVATGKAKIKYSDLDLLLVLKRKPELKAKNKINGIQKNLSRKYSAIFRDVGISLTYTNQVRKDKYGWGCFIKHLCVFIYGNDLGKNMPKFKPSKKVAEAFNGDIERHIKVVLKKLKSSIGEGELKSICGSIMRKIVRTGFSLVMERENAWTTDLRKSCEVFSKYYPEQSKSMKTALILAKKPSKNSIELKNFLDGFGHWITEEFKRELNSNN